MDRTLSAFHHPAAYRHWHWDVKHAHDVGRHTNCIPQPDKRRLAEYFFLQFESSALPQLADCRTSVIHGDPNDHNVLVGPTNAGEWRTKGIIDFGDLVQTHTICELAIALAYIMFRRSDPVVAALPLIQGYHSALPLEEREVDLLFPLVCARLCTTVTFAGLQQTLQSDNDYLTVSEAPAWDLLERLLTINPLRAQREFRDACRLPSPHPPGFSRKRIQTERSTHIGKSLSLSYREPIKIVRGAMQYLFDDEGQTYLDCVNNVCHVGHCHPTVARAAQKQIALLNTNTRYLHDNLVQYAMRLTTTLPEPLTVCYFVNSGSEANELAIRLAKTHTNRRDFVVLEHAYHGNTASSVEISPYKFDGPGGRGAPPHVHKVPMPDTYRGQYRAADAMAGKKYADHIGQRTREIGQSGTGLAGFFCESHMGVGGQIILPEGYLQEAYGHVRKAGGVCIADEVQVGFGRLGSHFWGFETQGVVPDVVTLGKPIGNGHPLGAVVTTKEIADSFATGMEYFNTFGGNPVSCAVGLAVLEVIQNEQLQHNAAVVGRHLKAGLEELMQNHELIGNVRGLGLFLGIELVRSRKDLTPATTEASRIVEQMRQMGILLSTDGPFNNVIKIKPPLVFTKANADRVVDALHTVLTREARGRK
jgi:4-aminobutyrate aminotransferase-like enzyme